MSVTDPFADPTDIPSEHPNAASFRGRLVLIQPTSLELDVPNRDNPALKADKVTATVTVVDGLGDVFLCPNQIPSQVSVPGPTYEGVWFSQDRVVKGLCPGRVLRPGAVVLARLETYKPGKPAQKGNPWGLVTASDADKQTARDFLANRTIAQATAPAQDKNPFAPATDAPF